MNEEQIIESFLSHSCDADLSLIEGNRGLYDSLDLDGLHSTAELAKLLKTPVLIVVDVTMATRTMAAVIKGCQAFDPDLDIAAVILNRVAGSRQEALISSAIEKYCGTPVVGSIPRLKRNLFPERHMGLVPHQERSRSEKAIAWAKAVVEENLDLEKIWRLAHDVGPLEKGNRYQKKGPSKIPNANSPRIGFLRDSSFWFYYPENLDQLRNLGAVLVEVNSITEKEVPDLDALYIGGGFPETQAKALADNKRFRDSLKQKIEVGLPVYAECGGLLYLGETLLVNEKTYPMVGALPLRFLLEKKPQGHGYTILEVKRQNPYFQTGEVLRGHEFHYSKAVITREEGVDFVFKVTRGHGVDGRRDGLCRKNLLATYTHIHAAGNPGWAKNLFRAALAHQRHEDRNLEKG
jgi:cobyrinic acid a,c-diamide synthase